MPSETRRYVAMIAPMIQGIYPQHRSPAEAYAMNQLPYDIPPGLRYGGGQVLLASAHVGGRHKEKSHTVRYARLPEPPVPHVMLASAGSGPSRDGFHLISQAMAEPAPMGHGSGWAVQVGAYSHHGQAESAVHVAKAEAHATLGAAHPIVASVHQAHATLWRARLTGLSKESALKACAALSRSRKNCVVLSPEFAELAPDCYTRRPKGRLVCARGWWGGRARNQRDTSRPTKDRRQGFGRLVLRSLRSGQVIGGWTAQHCGEWRCFVAFPPRAHVGAGHRDRGVHSG